MKNTIKTTLILATLISSSSVFAFWGSAFNPMDEFFRNNNNYNNYNNNYRGNYSNNGYKKSYNDFNNNIFGNAASDMDINMDMDLKFKIKMDADMYSDGNYIGDGSSSANGLYNGQNFWHSNSNTQNKSYNTYAPERYRSFHRAPKRSFKYYDDKIRQQKLQRR